jgi:hypothetical protein
MGDWRYKWHAFSVLEVDTVSFEYLIYPPTYQPTNQLTNQTTNQPINQMTNQPPHQPTNHPFVFKMQFLQQLIIPKQITTVTNSHCTYNTNSELDSSLNKMWNVEISYIHFFPPSVILKFQYTLWIDPKCAGEWLDRKLQFTIISFWDIYRSRDTGKFDK